MATPTLVGDATIATDYTSAPGATYNVTVDSGTQGSNRCLVAYLTWDFSFSRNLVAGAPTYNAVSLSAFASHVSTGRRCALYSLVAPATGSNTLVMDPGPTNGQNMSAACGYATYQDVDQTTPLIGAISAGTFGQPSVTVTSVAATDLAIMVGSGGSDSIYTHPSTSTEIMDIRSNGVGTAHWGGAAHRASGGTGTEALTWSGGTNANYTAIGARLQYQAPAGGGATVLPGVGQVLAAGLSPTVTTSNHQRVIPGVGVLAATGFAPVIQTPRVVRPGVGQVTVTGYSPAALAGTTVSTGVGVLTVAGLSPTVTTSNHQRVATGVGALTVSGFAPTIIAPVSVSTGVGALSVTGFVPSVLVSQPATAIVSAPATVRFLNPTMDVRFLNDPAIVRTLNPTATVRVVAAGMTVRFLNQE